jgi:enediyne biosynthesis protein E4
MKIKQLIGSAMCFVIYGFSTLPSGLAVSDSYYVGVTEEAGLTGKSAFRIAVADLNGDAFPDLFIHEQSDEVNWNVLNKARIYLNTPGDVEGARKFVDFTDESGIHENRRGDSGGRHASLAVFADLDNDGDLDMFNGLYYHRLEYMPEDRGDRFDVMLNDGQGHFTFSPDLTIFNTGLYNTSSAVFLDFDNDGNIDLYVGNWFQDYANNVFSHNILFQGHGDGSFTDVTEAAGLLFDMPCYAVNAADWNNDGWVDLFAGNYCRAHSVHWKNNGNGTFTQVQTETHYGDYIGDDSYGQAKCSWGSMPRDFDNDGDIDLFEIMVHGGQRFYSCPLVNEGGIFTWAFDRVTRTDDPGSMHQGDHFGSWLEIDNDGLADFVLTECGYGNNRTYIFKQQSDNTFLTMNAESGIGFVNTADWPPHNASPIDYNLDGCEDIIIGFASSDSMQLLKNTVGSQNNWLGIMLEGEGVPGKSNRSAIGARVEVKTASVTYTQDVNAGNGHFSPQHSLRLMFGLGQAAIADSITVHWPNAAHSSDIIRNVAVNQFLTIKESEPPRTGVRFQMPDTYFSPGNPCSLTADLTNASPDPIIGAPLFVILDIAGQYWYWDSWSQNVNFKQLDVPPGTTSHVILPEFIWPDSGSSSFMGMIFWGAMLNSEMTEILGGAEGLAQFEFGFGPEI